MKQLTFNRTSKFTFFPIPQEDISPNFIFFKGSSTHNVIA